MIVQYWGTPNYNEFPLTGVQRLWTTGQAQDVPTAIATLLLAAGVGFQSDSSNYRGEPALVSTDSSNNPVGLNVGGQAVVLSDVQAKASSIQTRAICAFPTQISSHGVNRNTHMQFTTETHFDQMRIVLLNAQTSTQTGIQASIGVSANPIADATAMNSFVPDASVNVTWSAASSVTQAVGVGVKDVSYTVSDWMDISSVNPATGNFPFVHLRIFQPSTNAQITNTTMTNLGWMATASDGRVFNAWYKDTTDLSQNMPAFSSGAAAAPRGVSFLVQYKSRGRIRTLGVFGDSLAFGQGGTNYGEGYARLLQRSLSSTARPVELANLGMPGATTTEFYNNMVKLVALGIVPHWSIYHAGSPNDISSTISASQITTMRSQLTKAVDSLLTNGSIPFVATWVPANTAAKNWGATDSLRVAYNNQVRAMAGANVLDIDTAVAGVTTGGQVQIASGMANADNLHINDVGAAAEFAIASPKFALAS